MSAGLVAELCCALAGREDHAALLGVTARPVWKTRRVFVWNDYLKNENGVIGSVPETEACETTAALITIMKNWREYARRQSGGVPRDRVAAARALAARAAS